MTRTSTEAARGATPYDVQGALSDGELAQYQFHLSRVHRAYAARLRIAEEQLQAHQPVPVRLYRTARDFRAVLEQVGLEVGDARGLYYETAKGPVLAAHIENACFDDVLATLQHEGFHQFAHQFIGDRIPVWANEGLAQFFEGGVFIGDRLALGMLDPPRVRLLHTALRNGNIFPFQLLLSLSDGEWADVMVSDRLTAGLYFAQSWGMAYYFLRGEKKQLRPAFLAYLQAVSRGGDRIATFNECFGVMPGEMETPWKQFVQRMEPDPVVTARHRLTFLGMAMRHWLETGRDWPRSFNEFASHLRAMPFETRATFMSSQVVRFKSSDDRLYGYDDATGQRLPFEMLSPLNAGEPPRLTAPGLRPQPSLTWVAMPGGQFMPNVQFH